LKEELRRLEEIERPPLLEATEEEHSGATQAEVELARIDQRIQYLQGRIGRAIVVGAAAAAPDRVHFGSIVTVRDQKGHETRYHIVGEDETDVEHNRVSCFSPLAKALMTKRIGEKGVWHRPIGDLELTVVAIEQESGI
jgi:transcription elongation GreA/GreB family factor